MNAAPTKTQILARLAISSMTRRDIRAEFGPHAMELFDDLADNERIAATFDGQTTEYSLSTPSPTVR